MTDPIASYTSNYNLNVKFYNRLSVLRKPLALNRWKYIFGNFDFIFAYNLPITFYDFDFSFLKIILKSTLYGLLQGKVYLLFSTILKQNDYSFPTLRKSLFSPF